MRAEANYKRKKGKSVERTVFFFNFTYILHYNPNECKGSSSKHFKIKTKTNRCRTASRVNILDF